MSCFLILHQQQQLMASIVAAQAQAPVVSAAITTAASAPRALPLFKAPSVQPPSFDSLTKNKAAHENQKTIDEYLHTAENMARINGHLADNETPGKTKLTNFKLQALLSNLG